MSNWAKFDKAFSQVSSFVVLDNETKNVIAKIALKYPKDSTSRLSCYMHIVGTEVQIGTATGFGLDKRTAAMVSAARSYMGTDIDLTALREKQPKAYMLLDLLQSDKAKGGWQEVINEKNGFLVIQAI